MQHIAVLAVSGRMLAQVCNELGYIVHVIDCFNDLDTRDIAQSTHQLSFSGSGFNQDEVNTALDTILNKFDLVGVLVGSGIESCPEVIDLMSSKTKVIGHSSEVFKQVHNAKHFFSVLETLNISHPETVFSFPSNKEKTWICKRSGALGGQHISEYKSAEAQDNSVYFQTLEQGMAMSALFFANQKESSLLGLHRLILHNDFQYAGAIRLSENEHIEIKKTLMEYFNLLQKEFGLQGLCGMDFVLTEEEEIKVLEINARPTATLGLYEEKSNFVKNHINIFLDEPVCLQKGNEEFCFGEAVVFAEKNAKWAKNLKNLDFISDIPALNSEFEQGEPVCTVSASRSNAAETEKLLYDCRQFIQSQLEMI